MSTSGDRRPLVPQGLVDDVATVVEAVHADHRPDLRAAHAGKRPMEAEKSGALAAAAEFTRRIGGRIHAQQVCSALAGSRWAVARQLETGFQAVGANGTLRAGNLMLPASGHSAAESATRRR